MTMTQSAARLDQEQTEGGFSAPGADHWQSFTAGITGALAQLDLKVGSGLVDEPQDGTIRIYKGEGVDGQLLSEQPVTFDAYPAAWQTFGLHAQPTVVAGGRYSYRFAVPEVDVTWVNLAKPGPYAGGRAGYGPNRDLLFKTYVVPAELDQEQTTGGYGAGSTDQWQSFTAGITGGLAQLDLKVGSGLVDEPQDGTIRIYEGEGVDGRLLSEQPVTFDAYPAAWQAFGLHSPATVVAGKQYTYRLSVPKVDVGWVDHAHGAYAGGRASADPNWDLLFKTYVVPAELDQEQTTGGYAAGSTDQWQSFTAGITGGLVKLDVKVGSGLVDEPQDGTIRIYEGEGVDGRLLSEQPVTFDAYPAAWQAFGLHSPATVVAGKQYTYRLSVPKVDVGWVDHAHGAYAGGRASADPSWDLLFKTYVAPAG